MKLRLLAATAAMACAAGALAADKPVVQDGIEVRPMSRFRVLSSGTQMNEQARLQYSQLLNEAEQKHALVPATDPQAIRLRKIAERIIPFAARWNPEASKWQWQVNLLNSRTVNAFCMPGGKIAFFTGILTTLKMTDDEVAAVMGHEIAHALREHSREQQGKNMVTSIFGMAAGAVIAHKSGVDPHIGAAGGAVAAKGLALKYSRDDEREADLVGLDIAARAGFDPRAGVVLWQKMGALNKQAPPALLSTHPLGPERIEQINKHLPQLLPVYAKTRGTTADKLPSYKTS